MSQAESRIELRIAGDQPESVRLLGVCIRHLARIAFDPPQASEVELAIVEAVNNSILHARPGGTDIRVHFTLAPGRAHIELIDQGQPLRDAGLLESGAAPFDFDPADIEKLPVGGMGLKLIRQLMNDVGYRRENGYNRWSFTKFALPAGGGADDASSGRNGPG